MSLTPAEQAAALAVGTGFVPYGGGTTTIGQFQTFDRRLATGTPWAPTTQVLTMSAIWLPQGAVVTAITFVSGSQVESGGSHLWFALYRGDNLALLAQTSDATGSAAFAANTAYRATLTAAQTCPYSGLYYLGFACQASSNVPTLLCAISGSLYGNGGATGMTPVLSGTSTGSLGASAPNPAATLTAITQSLYAFVD
jgi:hypothetical protein